MKIENARVYNISNAILTLHNIDQTWGDSDSIFGLYTETQAIDIINAMIQAYYPTLNRDEQTDKQYQNLCDIFVNNIILNTNSRQKIAEVAAIGPQDMKLAKKAGRSFLENILVSMEITAPLFWWREFSSKINYVENELILHPITALSFEVNDYDGRYGINEDDNIITPHKIIEYCEQLRQNYLSTKDKQYYKELVRWLPQSWLKTSIWNGSYKDLFKAQSQNHKLQEWDTFFEFVKTLPYAEDLILIK